MGGRQCGAGEEDCASEISQIPASVGRERTKKFKPRRTVTRTRTTDSFYLSADTKSMVLTSGSHPGVHASLGCAAPPFSNLRSFVSKCTVLKEVANL